VSRVEGKTSGKKDDGQKSTSKRIKNITTTPTKNASTPQGRENRSSETSNDRKWKQTITSHYFSQKQKQKQKVYVYSGADQSRISEEAPTHDKDNNINTMSFLLWNCRALTHEKRTLINSRTEDVIILNETWENSSSISGYTISANVRKNQRGGGVSILVRDDFEIKNLDDSVKDTLVVKVLLNKSRYLLIITSYFPCTNDPIM